MEYFTGWLTLSGIGILFGLFPGWYSSACLIGHAIVIEHKKVSPWLYYIVGGDHWTKKADLSKSEARAAPKYTWTVSLVYVLLILALMHYFARADYVSGNIIAIIMFDTSFSLFLLLTWLVPAYLTKRYVRKLKTTEEVRDSTYISTKD